MNIAADLLAFFLQPEVHCHFCIRFKEMKAEEPCTCSVRHVEYQLYELMSIHMHYSAAGDPSLPEAGQILINLHQDLLQGKYDSVEKLRKTLTWIGEDEMERLRKEGEEGLAVVHRMNKRRKISKRQRLKFRAYFVQTMN
ncbi:hypothetical protein MKW94_016091 [Papaver nudicaule]|uniref:Uncharacterized protein n=1 Tax=Papaver nudicaule TaxID=74823 RepID=A0AA41SFW5_PAPNU|nr:hypothetical protein [Papaver nudicaule]